MAEINWTLWEEMAAANGRDRSCTVSSAAEGFARSCVDNPNYIATAKRNGTTQAFLIIAADDPHKSTIVAMPNETLNEGDYITAFGETWLVYKVRLTGAVTKVGTLWLCNETLRWQSGNSTVVERPCVVDSGSYATTEEGNNQILSIDGKKTIWLPLDEATRRLYMGKRIAFSTTYKSNDEEVLDVYKITAYTPESGGVNSGNHLLSLDIRATADYNPATDNITQKICDYIQLSESGNTGTSTSGIKTTTISGGTTMRLAATKKWSVSFVNDGVADSTAIAVWDVSPSLDGMAISSSVTEMYITLPRNIGLTGQAFTITVRDSGAIYPESEITVEVV